ncbi:OsmC family protein [Alicyclobacillus fastidiosus]|uniref:OsmC family protein n=1 Tax=Alicyclobacillus fastidiosus TaxID=392011 RepID=A0ABY6ZCW0_9BACL|nr:OsmC family protein [Alicyclobacillus fastidiosus]WAH40725.1 OsmC family protein [Alicyclobacillus fastidiosus]GMA62196.1 stress protein [Alicyclobacillus fastidiosus]
MVISRSGSDTYVTRVTNGIDEIYSDTSEDKGGSGKHFRPHELLEAGYASCLNITTRMVLDSMSLSYGAVTVNVKLDRSDPAKSVFKYQIEIEGLLDEEIKRTVLKKVANCPVKRTLSKQLEFMDETNIV